MKCIVLFIIATGIMTQSAHARIPLSQLAVELEARSYACNNKQKKIYVLLKSAEVHLVCGSKVQPLRAVVVERHRLQHNYKELPQTTYMTRIELFPTWKRTRSMIAESCKRGKCKSDRLYRHGDPGNPFDLGKIFLQGMGKIRIHDVAPAQKKRLAVFQRESERYASNGCVNLETESLKKLLAFADFDPLDRENQAYKKIPITFTND